MQSKLGSMIEACVGTGIGFVVAWIAMVLVLPLFGFPATVGQSFWIVAIFTVLSIVRVYLLRRVFNWFHRPYDSCIGNNPLGDEDEAVMWVKHLVHIWGCRIDLHKMVRADGVNCFHSHPAWAIRIPIWGGYIEEGYNPEKNKTFFRFWRPWSVGVVAPRFVHRIAELLNGRVSYSLWLRGPIVRNVFIGGWRETAGTRRFELHELAHME